MRQLFFFAALLTMAALASAGPFTNVVVFGDSLSDNGNIFMLTGQPPAPYYNGRFSNGPVAVEYVAGAFGAPLRDYAFAGATTGLGNISDGGNRDAMGAFNLPGMLTTFGALESTLPPIAANSLFILWGGPMDFLYPPAGEDPSVTIARAVGNLVTMAATLEGVGAHHILVPGMPDLGLTPRLLGMGPAVSAGASALTDAFNATLKANLPPGVTYYDTAALLRSVVGNPAAFGFTNVNSPCLVGTVACPNPDQYVFWDDIHPTTRAHEVVAREFESAVPEPAAIVLVVTGLGVIATVRRLRR